MQRYSSLGTLVDLAAPLIDGSDRLEVVRARTKPVLDELAAERFEPFRVGAVMTTSHSSLAGTVYPTAAMDELLHGLLGFLAAVGMDAKPVMIWSS